MKLYRILWATLGKDQKWWMGGLGYVAAGSEALAKQALYENIPGSRIDEIQLISNRIIIGKEE